VPGGVGRERKKEQMEERAEKKTETDECGIGRKIREG